MSKDCKRTLRTLYKPLGDMQYSKHEAYHIKHGKDTQLLDDILVEIIGFKLFLVRSEILNCNECIVEVEETHDMALTGEDCEIFIYTPSEWKERLEELTPNYGS